MHMVVDLVAQDEYFTCEEMFLFWPIISTYY